MGNCEPEQKLQLWRHNTAFWSWRYKTLLKKGRILTRVWKCEYELAEVYLFYCLLILQLLCVIVEDKDSISAFADYTGDDVSGPPPAAVPGAPQPAAAPPAAPVGMSCFTGYSVGLNRASCLEYFRENLEKGNTKSSQFHLNQYYFHVVDFCGFGWSAGKCTS